MSSWLNEPISVCDTSIYSPSKLEPMIRNLLGQRRIVLSYVLMQTLSAGISACIYHSLTLEITFSWWKAALCNHMNHFLCIKISISVLLLSQTHIFVLITSLDRLQEDIWRIGVLSRWCPKLLTEKTNVDKTLKKHVIWNHYATVPTVQYIYILCDSVQERIQEQSEFTTPQCKQCNILCDTVQERIQEPCDLNSLVCHQ